MKKRILITGGSGFIGSSLKNYLQNSDYEILTIGRSDKEDYKVDLTVGTHGHVSLKTTIDNFLPDIVCHFASGSNIARAEQNKEKEFNDVVLGTQELIKVLKNLKLKPKIIYLSSQAVYGLPEYLPVSENHPKKPITVYGENKLKAENIIADSSLDYFIFRVSSAYGYLQDPAKSGVIAKFINKLKNNESPIVFNSIDLYSDFIYVDDIISALVQAIQSDAFTEKGIYNLGAGKPTTIKELLDVLYKHFPKAPEPKFEINELYPSEKQKGLYLDISKTQKDLKWSPKHSIENGLKLIISRGLLQQASIEKI